jgi:hypothetical protein
MGALAVSFIVGMVPQAQRWRQLLKFVLTNIRLERWRLIDAWRNKKIVTRHPASRGARVVAVWAGILLDCVTGYPATFWITALFFFLSIGVEMYCRVRGEIGSLNRWRDVGPASLLERNPFLI